MKQACLALLLLTSLTAGREYQDRWFYLSRNLTADSELDELRTLAATARQHGYNGVCWAGLETVYRWPAERLARLEQAKAICAAEGLEIIPLVFSVGYGGGALGYDRNLAVGLPASATFKVEGTTATLEPEAGVVFKNAGYEEWRDGRAVGWAFHDKPGEVTFADQEVKHSGTASLRLENPGARGLGSHARAMQVVPVKPRRHYRLSFWLKAAEALPLGSLRVQIYSGGEPAVNLVASSINEATFDWREFSLEFNSLNHEQVRIYAGTWGGQSGAFWLDDWRLEEIGLNNIVRRDGCPLTVTGADGTVYEEGRDFEPVVDPKLLNFANRPGPALTLTPTTRIPAGARLTVHWYHAMPVQGGQISVCMSEPKLYEYYEAAAAGLARHVPSRKFLLSMDEIRQGGTDLADQQRNLTMGQILGDCVTRQQEILRRQQPGATCYIWSDMFDPGHNAHGDYYQVQGDFTGSWDCIPKDLVMACWYGQRAKESLAFFSERGFATLAAAYYDTDDLSGSRAWLEALALTPKATGIMYTTWRNKYALLAPFGDLVREFERR
ncbi:MAG: carbohydrate binding domain-containing protein [Armatimonadetes bacterium]|nr:carbohydrate binding domain-containing protein [Armatimonadota bacterium]